MLVILEEAITELDDAFVWHETKFLGLGEKFIENIEKGLILSGITLKLQRKRTMVFTYML